MRTDSSLFEQFTLGIEEEFQIDDVKAVVDQLIEMTMEKVPREAVPSGLAVAS